jgi:glycine/D-amino acid oxidase-like deaminating enzyme
VLGRTPDGLRTSNGVLPGDIVVNAAGPWAGMVADNLGAHLPVQPRRGTILVTAKLPPRVFHKVYDGDYVGTTQSSDEGLQTSAVVESTRAGTLLIGSSRQRVGFDDRLDIGELAAIARRAIALFPALARVSLLRSYTGFRPYLPDHLPVIGPDPEVAGLWHVTGHEGAGVGLSTISAALLADLVTGATPIINPAPFAADRPSLQAEGHR